MCIAPWWNQLCYRIFYTHSRKDSLHSVNFTPIPQIHRTTTTLLLSSQRILYFYKVSWKKKPTSVNTMPLMSLSYNSPFDCFKIIKTGISKTALDTVLVSHTNLTSTYSHAKISSFKRLREWCSKLSIAVYSS